MCSFKSGIYTRDGRLLMSPFTDSHDELLIIFGLTDQNTPECARFVRLEYQPNADYSAFVMKVDELRTPGWFDEEQRQLAESGFAAYIEKISVREPQQLLIGGQYLLYDGATVEQVSNCAIVAMLGSSRVGTMRESSQVGTMRDSSRVGEMRDSSQVGTMLASSRVGTMRDSSQVGTMWESSQVGIDKREKPNEGLPCCGSDATTREQQ